MLSPTFDEFFRKGGNNQLGCSILTIRKFQKLLSLKTLEVIVSLRLGVYLDYLSSHEPLVNYILRYQGFDNRLNWQIDCKQLIYITLKLVCFLSFQPQDSVCKVPEDSPCYSSK